MTAHSSPEYNARYRADHRAERLSYDAAYYEQRREARKAQSAAIYKKNRVKRDAQTTAWRLAHPEYYLFKSARARAKGRGIPFAIVPADIAIPSHCPALGIPLVPGARAAHPGSPSLDRIVPSLGYVKGNILVISHRANAIKSDASAEELAKVCDWLKHRALVEATQ